jgi:hypothetical protein
LGPADTDSPDRTVDKDQRCTESTPSFGGSYEGVEVIRDAWSDYVRRRIVARCAVALVVDAVVAYADVGLVVGHVASIRCDNFDRRLRVHENCVGNVVEVGSIGCLLPDRCRVAVVFVEPRDSNSTKRSVDGER